jgi:DNA-binding transcriptional LysR family regulator
MRKTNDLNDIRIFVAAAESGTFTGAAKYLHLPTSTVSRSLTRLEKHMDLLLVRRGQHGLAVTDPGKEYLLCCKRALRILKEGGELLAKHRSNPSGLIRVACPITMARDVIAPLLSKFVDTFPDLRVEIEPYCSAFDQEPKEDIDLFFKVRAPRDSSRRIRLYPATARGLFASRDYLKIAGIPTDPAELAEHRCIGSGEWTLSMGKKVVTPALAFQVVTSDPLVHRQLVLDGAGIAILPLWIALDPAIAKRLVRVLPSWKPKPIVLCALYSASSQLTPQGQDLSGVSSDLSRDRSRPTAAREQSKGLFH